MFATGGRPERAPPSSRAVMPVRAEPGRERAPSQVAAMGEIRGAGSEFGDPRRGRNRPAGCHSCPGGAPIGAPFQKREHSGEPGTMYQQSLLKRHVG